ncbi:MAG TPA: DUF3106 domain-containing protein [Terriglobia bacterium]|nr:DUF3106 domain-containing protein [Terriglobia bacterium]
MTDFIHNVPARCPATARAAVARPAGMLCLAALLWTSSGALAEGFDPAGREGFSNQDQATLAAFLWQQEDRPAPPARPGLRRGNRGRPGLPPALLERLRNLTPEQRERILENNRRFQQLPPERQELLRERLRQLRDLPPEQRELVEQRFAIFSNLTPEQQEKARVIYRDRWSKLPPERRRALMQEFRYLRRLDPGQRKNRLESREFQEQFSSEERDVLAQLISL